ncbi:MAG: 1-acyl-sn-glycerol-3-phosphate acyltransferase [Pedosphaera sp.]|nr:1-acyl-sn-glycerol-3-phosphate acyltransferase [Pedosphaera sp.]
MIQLPAACRSVWSSILFLVLAVCALVAVACPKTSERLLPLTRRRARWLRLWSSRLQSIIGLEVESRGRPPTRGMLVCNHLSYLDMLALTSAGEMVFLSKIEVGGWPLIGQIARASGALFVNRSRRGDVADIEPEFVEVIEQGVVLTMFPEGTSSGGDRVLPFLSSLLAPAAERGWPVTPAWIGYSLEDGSVENEVAYWLDMIFLPHFLNLLGKRRIKAVIHFGEPRVNPNRKALARELHSAVRALALPFNERFQVIPLSESRSQTAL